MAAWSKLAHCRNPKCPFGGSCGQLYPAESYLGVLCICLCLQKRQQADLKADILEKAFDPSSKSWTKLSERLEKRKKPKASTIHDDAPPAKRHTSSSTASKTSSKLIPFTVVLVENPAKVNANKYTMPNAAKHIAILSPHLVIPF
ncbi:hypothetical protein C8J57DRAFT_1227060 [Mycena rebaudengoi]|nr:hypothetical protein C8J57DRAFT_1227060 [Mycena rebaudengoi]